MSDSKQIGKDHWFACIFVCYSYTCLQPKYAELTFISILKDLK